MDVTVLPTGTPEAGNHNNERRTNLMKKLIALILSLCMLAGLIPAMAETATETPPESEKVNMNRLIDELLSDVHDAVVKVDMADLKAKSTVDPEKSKGTVFTVLKKVLTDISNAIAENGKENEDLKRVLEHLDSLQAAKDVDEKELEVLSSLVLLAVIADANEITENPETEDPQNRISIANRLLKAVFEACQENETLTAAVKATDSKLFDMLLESNRHLKEYVEKNGALTVVDTERNADSYAAFEAEIKKLEDYLKASEGPKQSALDMLALLHAAMDDIHEAIEAPLHKLTKDVDGTALVSEMMKDLGEAVSKINLDEVKAKAGENFTTKGSIYSVFDKVVNNILADAAVKIKEDETLTKILETLGKLDQKDVTEEEAEALFALMFVGLAAGAEETASAEPADPADNFRRASAIMKATYDTVLENDTITAAIKTTGSPVLEMLQKSNNRLKQYLEKNGTLRQMDDAIEAPIIVFEAELAKLRDYIAGLKDKGHERALGLLDLLHEYVDDIHEAIDGHTHENVEKEAAAFATGVAFGMKLDEVIAAIGKTNYEIDREHTHGPVTFTELEYEHVTVNGKSADEHYLFAGDELVAIQICFKNGVLTFDQAVADLTKLYGDAQDVDLAVLANGVYAVDDDGHLEGRAAAIAANGMMVVIGEDKDEVEVTYIDLTAAYILAQ